MFSIADKLINVRQRIKKAEIAENRPSQVVRLLAVTKTRSASDLYSAMKAGLRYFGENYVNEAISKQVDLQTLCSPEEFTQLEWHFIGPVQSNKTKVIAQHFDWVQSVDRAKIAQRLDAQRPSDLPPLNICIQVNINHEASKSGLNITEVENLAGIIDSLANLKLRGLMTIPKAEQSKEALSDSFLRLKSLFDTLKFQYPDMDTLSMGMSGDIETAIECGSTMVRVGTALFGPRPAKVNETNNT